MNPQRIKAVALLAGVIAVPAEGLRQYAYYDPPGILTVCYGSTTNVVKGKKYTIDECRERLNKDMAEAVLAVERCAPGLPEHVHAAFADAVYNIGPRVACGPSSTAALHLKAGRIEQACRELPRWDKAKIAGKFVSLPGLTKRRAAEMKMCLGLGSMA